MSIAIDSIEIRKTRRQGVIHELDVPKKGFRYDALELAGWVVDRSPTPVALQVLQGPQLLVVETNVPRPDVPARVRGAAADVGYQVELGALDLDEKFELTIRCARADGTVVELATVRGTRDPLPRTYEPSFQPLMITTFGRTGSTWLMRLLSRHPALVACREYPYEIRPAVYWLHAARVLTRPAGAFAGPTDPVLRVGPNMVGVNPYYARPATFDDALSRWFSSDYLADVIALSQRSIDGFYRRIADAQDQPAASRFVEKFPVDQLPATATAIYAEPREILLIRDLRDVVASMRAFDQKRGMRAFGRETRDDSMQLLNIVGAANRLFAASQLRPASTLVVRYEDLVRDPSAELARILEFVGVDGSNELIQTLIQKAAAEDGEQADHRTSESAVGSVGRWRRDLEPALAAQVGALGGNFLRVFGYETMSP